MTAKQEALGLEIANISSEAPVEYLNGNETAGGEPSRRKSLVQLAPVARNTETREYARSQTCPTVAPTSGSTYAIGSAFEPHSGYYFEHSLEDLLRELLHPLVKQWLNLNLPGIVERLVNEEFERMVERSNH